MKGEGIAIFPSKSKTDYVCGECSSTFDRKYNLERHLKNIHGSKTDFVCGECSNTFDRKYNLERHLKNIHGFVTRKRCDGTAKHYEQLTKERPSKDVVCEVCGKVSTRSNIRRHMNRYHSETSPDTPDTKKIKCPQCVKHVASYNDLSTHMFIVHGSKYVPQNIRNAVCSICQKTYCNKYKLQRHLQQAHYQVAPVSKTIKCPLCETYERTRNDLDEHIHKAHDTQQDIEEASFSTMEEFLAWKKQRETQLQAQYIMEHGSKNNNTYYICHRSGSSRGKWTGRRHNSNKFFKIGSICPSRIQLSQTGDGFHAKFMKTHIGHESCIKFLRLSKEERSQLAGRIKEGVAFDRILDDIRESVSTCCGTNRMHLVEKKDLHNIMRDFGLKKDNCHAVTRYKQTTVSIKQDQQFEDDKNVVIAASTIHEGHIADASGGRAELDNLMEITRGMVMQIPHESVPEAIKACKHFLSTLQKLN